MRDVRIVADAAELARVGAAEFLDRMGHAAREGRPFRVALAGGRTPRGVYEELAAATARGPGAAGWAGAQVFFGDERAVPPDHDDSNYRMAREALLSRVPIPDRQVHRVPAEMSDPGEAAEAYERQIRRAFGLAPDQLPRFDLVLMGLGADGHVASLFPGNPTLLERRRLVTAPWVEQLQAHRITLTLPAINRAACVVFLVSGVEKAPVLRTVLQGNGAPGSLPAQLVRPENGSVVWLVDRAAASGLSIHT